MDGLSSPHFIGTAPIFQLYTPGLMRPDLVLRDRIFQHLSILLLECHIFPLVL